MFVVIGIDPWQHLDTCSLASHPPTHTHTHTHTRTHARTHTRVHAHTHTHAHTQKHTHSCTHANTHAHTNTHKQTKTLTHIRAHTGKSFAARCRCLCSKAFNYSTNRSLRSITAFSSCFQKNILIWKWLQKSSSNNFLKSSLIILACNYVRPIL